MSDSDTPQRMALCWPSEDGMAVTFPSADCTIEDVATALLPESTLRAVVAVSALPPHHWRDAWTFDPVAGAVVDLVRARTAHITRIRAARAPLLEALDVRFQRALEDEDDEVRAAVVAQKRALRGLPDDPAIAAARTPDDLASAWPNVLGPSPYARSAT